MSVGVVGLVWAQCHWSSAKFVLFFFSGLAGRSPIMTDMFGASRGPGPSTDGLVSVTGLAMAGHSRNPRLAWLLFKNQKTI